MPKLKTHVPKMCRHHRGQAFIKLGGEQIWLGPYGSQQAREAYDRIVAEWLSHGRRLPQRSASNASSTITVRRVVVEFWDYARQRYTPSEQTTFRSALQILEQLYGSEPAERVGPQRLRVIRDTMVRKGWSRRHTNKQVSRLRSVYRWAASREFIEEAAYRRLTTLEPLRRGEAREGRDIKPVPREHIRMARPYLTRPVRATVMLQLLTGCRADELLRLRPMDIDRSGSVWKVNPIHHKTAHHDKDRTILIGPRGKRVLRLFLSNRGEDQYLFDPRESHAEVRRRGARGGRRANQKPNPRRTDRTVGDHYTTASYRRQIHRACRKAFPAPQGLDREAKKQWVWEHQWSPHRLRHTAATSIRRGYGLEVASIILGHASLDITQVYAERNMQRAIEVMREVG